MIKKLLIILAMIWPASLLADNTAYGSPYLVTYLFDNLRIVLATDVECTHPGLSGKNAVVHRLDGLYIQGCWALEPGNEGLVRINWVKGDFSILPLKDFEPAGHQEGFNKSQ